jgi:hypothetical protein
VIWREGGEGKDAKVLSEMNNTADDTIRIHLLALTVPSPLPLPFLRSSKGEHSCVTQLLVGRRELVSVEPVAVSGDDPNGHYVDRQRRRR